LRMNLSTPKIFQKKKAGEKEIFAVSIGWLCRIIRVGSALGRRRSHFLAVIVHFRNGKTILFVLLIRKKNEMHGVSTTSW